MIDIPIVIWTGIKIKLRKEYLSLSCKQRILDPILKQFEKFQNGPMIRQPEPNRIDTSIGSPCLILPDRPTTSPIREVKEETLECMKETPKARITLVNEHNVDQAEGEIFEEIIKEIYETETDLMEEYDEHEETQVQTSNDPP